MSTKLFEGGQIAADVDRLVAVIGDTREGETVTHERIGAILGYGRGGATDRHYRSVLRGFQKRMLREGKPVTGLDAKGQGLRFLAQSERVGVVGRRLRSSRRRLHDGIRVVVTVDKTLLNPEQQRVLGRQEVLLALATGALRGCGLKLLRDADAKRLTSGS
jgi:hypothetical protein